MLWSSSTWMPEVETSKTPKALPTALLFRDHASYVAAFLLRLGAGPEERDDLVQEVFMTAHRLGGFVDNGSAKPTTWLCSIAVRVLANHRRKLSRRPQPSRSVGTTDVGEQQVSVVPADRGNLPDQVTAQRRSVTRVQSALNSLSVELRSIFVMYELEGESCVNIAQALSIPVGTVYSRLHQARKRFRAAFEKREKQPLTPLREGGSQ